MSPVPNLSGPLLIQCLSHYSLQGLLPRTEEDCKRSVIAKWTPGAKLQSPTVASVEGPRNIVGTPRDQLQPSQINLEAISGDRPTPAPRLSIAKNQSLQTSTSSSMNNSQDSGILSNRSTGTLSSQSGDNSLTQSDGIDYANGREQQQQQEEASAPSGGDQLRLPPPPLPPKPKVLPIRGPNWGGQPTKPTLYLDQPTSSFV